MIAIVRKTNKDGENLYNIQINKKIVTTFYHKREDGLSVCLEKAAKATKDIEPESDFLDDEFLRLANETIEKLKKKEDPGIDYYLTAAIKARDRYIKRKYDGKE